MELQIKHCFTVIIFYSQKMMTRTGIVIHYTNVPRHTYVVLRLPLSGRLPTFAHHSLACYIGGNQPMRAIVVCCLRTLITCWEQCLSIHRGETCLLCAFENWEWQLWAGYDFCPGLTTSSPVPSPTHPPPCQAHIGACWQMMNERTSDNPKISPRPF